MVQAAPELLHVHQGRVRGVTHLLKLFKNCLATADKLKGKG
jgi:hypothetical protein